MPNERAEHPLADLAARLQEKAVLLDQMAADVRAEAFNVFVPDALRLQGKAEGVRLALSFIKETWDV